MWTVTDIVYVLINLFKRLVSLFFNSYPIDEKAIFVNNFDGKGLGDNGKYIVEEILEHDPSFKVYWLGKFEEKKLKNINFISPNSLQAIKYQAISKYWISNVRMPLYSLKRKEQVYMQTWHGILGFKKIENECPEALTKRYIFKAKYDSMMTDFLIAGNKDQKKLYENFFWRTNAEILNIGYPRNDILVSKVVDREFIKNKYNLPNKKIVVYAPTFRKDGNLAVYNLNYKLLLNSLKQKFSCDWVCVVRLHPNIAKDSDLLIEYNEEIINGSYISDIQELLCITDLLITDYSSIAFDYLYRRKPVIQYAVDIEQYREDRDFHIDLDNLPFDVATSDDELNSLIINFDQDIYLNKVEVFMREYGFYNVGSSAKQAAIALLEK